MIRLNVPTSSTLAPSSTPASTTAPASSNGSGNASWLENNTLLNNSLATSSFQQAETGVVTSGVRAASSGASSVKLEKVSRYRQDDPEWSGQDYKFSKSGSNLGHHGCMITAYGNAFGQIGYDVKPTDLNDRTKAYRTAMKNAKFTDLSGTRTTAFDTFKSVSRNSNEGKAIEERIKKSLRNGNAVVIGITGGKRENGSRYPRHSITAAGINAEGKIMVVDGWRTNASGDNSVAGYMTLDEAMKFHGNATRFDTAMEVTKRPARRTS